MIFLERLPDGSVYRVSETQTKEDAMQPLMKRTTLRTMTAALAATTVLAVPAIADEHMMGATYNTGTVNEQVTDNLIRSLATSPVATFTP
jgi:hypothetical protein